MSSGVGEPSGIAGLRALAHPVRLRILSLLTGSDLSAAEVARELGLTHANASYHLRTLLAAGEIEVVGEEKVRGGVAKRYRYRPKTYDEGRARRRTSRASRSVRPAGPERLALYAAVAGELRRRAAEEVVGPERVATATDAELWVDESVWRDVVARVRQASHDLHEAARPARSPGAVRVNATIALFPMSTAGEGGR